jgi:hypothetical protein
VSRVNLLVVEDDETSVKSWKQRIEVYNADEQARKFEIFADYVASKDGALELIGKNRYDAAVVDLGLKVQKDGNTHNDEGNDVVDRLASSELAAIAIYTGTPGEAKLDRFRHIKVIEKGGGLDPIFAWLDEKSSIIFHMRDAIQTIRRDMASVFHGSIWPRWEYWTRDADNADDIVPALARHLASHTYAGLLSGTLKVHSEEHYFVPPLVGKPLLTGDLILRSDGVVEVVITPRCDMHANKTETVQLAECHKIGEPWNKALADSKGADEKAAAKAIGDLKQMRQHYNKFVIHFLPPMRDEAGANQGPWFVRFDRIRSVARNSDEEKDLVGLRFASITSEFLPALVQRLSTFFSRIGTPDLS